MKAKLFIALLFIVHCTLSQWSTSTKAESALFVCPGFYQGVVTFDDGSSIIYGGLSDSRYVQKLDPYGCKLWPQPVQVFNTPGTDNDASLMISDGEGGVFLWWADHRGANPTPFGYSNNALYMQHVDKNGVVRWQTGGIQVAPLGVGLTGAYGTRDGQRGIILYVIDSDTWGPNPTNAAKSWIVRYDSTGTIVWKHSIDSSNTRLPVGQPIKLGNIFQIQTLAGNRYYTLDGREASVPRRTVGGILLLRDSIAFEITLKPLKTDSAGNRIYTYAVTRISTSWDSLWHTEYNIIDETNTYGLYTVGDPYISDNGNGFYYVWRLKDKEGHVPIRAQWITESGPRWKNGDFTLSQKSACAVFNGTKTLGLFFGDGTAQLYDSTGRELWGPNNLVIGDLGNAYSPVYASDKNGGCIIAYWTTLGGIYAQHTGRVGRVGVITKISVPENTPLTFALQQNYPNPFNSMTTIQFTVGNEETVALAILDVLGREVQILAREKLQPGDYRTHWDASGFASGVYFCRLSVNERALTKKIMLLR